MSLEAKLKAKYQEDFESVDDVEELILDGLMSIDKISTDDKSFLERFTQLEFLSMNFLGLKTIENLPAIATLKKVSRILNPAARVERQPHRRQPFPASAVHQAREALSWEQPNR
jgi:hypothetical protein